MGKSTSLVTTTRTPNCSWFSLATWYPLMFVIQRIQWLGRSTGHCFVFNVNMFLIHLQWTLDTTNPLYNEPLDTKNLLDGHHPDEFKWNHVLYNEFLDAPNHLLGYKRVRCIRVSLYYWHYWHYWQAGCKSCVLLLVTPKQNTKKGHRRFIETAMPISIHWYLQKWSVNHVKQLFCSTEYPCINE